MLSFFKKKKIIPHIKLSGVIGNVGKFKQGIDFSGQEEIISKAFSVKKAPCVAITINSPGGSPVQSHLIYSLIRQQAKKNKKKVIIFAEDVAASGGYWLAVSADKIYLDPSSVVGSIGVISSGFGFNQLIERYGIERRVHTAGTSKSMLDPFQRQKDEDVVRLKGLLEDIHQTFRDYVIERRGNKLADRDLFTGEIWVGKKGVDDGLADDLGHLVPVMQKKFGKKVRFNVYGKKKNILSRIGMRLLGDLNHSIEERLALSRFGM